MSKVTPTMIHFLINFRLSDQKSNRFTWKLRSSIFGFAVFRKTIFDTDYTVKSVNK